MALAAAVLALTTVSASAATWDLAKDYSISNQNPNGAWTYGYIEGTAFTAYNSTNIEDAAGNTQYTWRHNNDWDTWGNFAQDQGPNPIDAWTSYREVGQVTGGPGQENRQTTALWTATVAGTYNVHVLVTGQSTKGGGSTVDTFVYQNLSLIDNGSVRGFYGRAVNNYTDRSGDSPFYAFDQVMTFAAGDTFAVGFNAADDGQSADNTGMEITITSVPEPGSIVAMLSGLIGLAGFSIRRRK